MFTAASALASDHTDGPAVTGDPAADITDVYAWMSATGKVEIALDVSPFATSTTKFSDAVTYAIHVNSNASFGATPTKETLVICQFDAGGTIQCWVGANEYVTGNASKTAGISSASGKVKVFAGLRNDPFFFNLDGFKNAVTTVEGASGLTLNGAGCPAVSQATSAALVKALQSTKTGGSPAVDNFAGANVLAIVLEIDKSLLNVGGPNLGIWASTHQKS
ncbi:MAG TPA: DUF4331 family protein [Polyangiaceae bacterium]|jgi:hypothetical protein|nr:DUF4331 family protein [Polyangiaceae bacterium]